MENIIIKYLENRASESEKQILLEWLRTDDQNKRLFAEVRNRWIENATISINNSECGKKAFYRFATRVESLSQTKRFHSAGMLLKIAASVAIIISASLVGYFVGERHVATDLVEEAIVMNHVVMGEGNKGVIVLPDGTKVWLNSDSKLIYPDRFSTTNRKVYLEGEGYFEVERNEHLPFLVETRGLAVNVLGTHFNVKNYDDSETIETTLVSGKVEVLLSESDESVVLSPNQKLTCDKHTGAFRVVDVEAEDNIVWKENKLICQNEPLSSVINKMRNWYNIEIECEAGVAMDQRLSLTVRRESPEEIFKLLSIISPIKYRIESRKVIISPKVKNHK